MKLLLTFYGDDFTGSTDALEQLALAGVRAALFIEPPARKQLQKFKNLQAIGVAGLTRSLTSDVMERELRPALKKLKGLGAAHVHYKVCSTFDSSPKIGSIGRVIDVASKIFHGPFVPLLVAAPSLGRYTIFGNHFARYGIGSKGAIYRLDRHPSVSKHPVTPMIEADLRVHLAKQTKKKIALFDITKVSLPETEARAELKKILDDKPAVVLFDALTNEHLALIGRLIDGYETTLFSVGSSGVETALSAKWKSKARVPKASRAKQILVGSGSCSPVTGGQIVWALKHGFKEVALDAARLVSNKTSDVEIRRASCETVRLLNLGCNVIVHTTKAGSQKTVAAKLRHNSAKILGTALGIVLRNALAGADVRRVCVAGGDTSSFAARALGIEALEMIATLTPGAPLCRAHAPRSPMDGRAVVFKGGQVGAENYFETVLKGKR